MGENDRGAEYPPFRFYRLRGRDPVPVAPVDGGYVDGCHGEPPLEYIAVPPIVFRVEFAEEVGPGMVVATDASGRARLWKEGDVPIAEARRAGRPGEVGSARFRTPTGLPHEREVGPRRPEHVPDPVTAHQEK